MLSLVLSLLISHSTFADSQISYGPNYAEVVVRSERGNVHRLFDSLKVPVDKVGGDANKSYLFFNHEDEPVFNISCLIANVKSESNCRIFIFRSSQSKFNKDRNYAYANINNAKDMQKINKKISHEEAGTLGPVFKSNDGDFEIWKVISTKGDLAAFVIRYTQARPHLD